MLILTGELKEWISEEAKNRSFYNDSEFVRSILYREKAKAGILDEMGNKIQEYLLSPEGEAAVRRIVRAEVRGEGVRQLIRQVVEEILQEYVVEED